MLQRPDRLAADPGDTSKEKVAGATAVIETTHFYWTQGGDFNFQAGDVIWLDRAGYESGIGTILQIKTATPAISAYCEIEQRWPAWTEDMDILLTAIKIKDTGDDAYVHTAKSGEIQLRRKKKRLPGSVTAELYKAQGGRNVKTATLDLTQDDLVRTLITGEGLI
jgi:hypothetical protein